MSFQRLIRSAHLGPLWRAGALLSINTAVRGLGACAALVLAYGLGAGPDMDRYMAFSLLTVAFGTLTASAVPALASRYLSGQSLKDAESVQACRSWARHLAYLGMGAYLLALPVCVWAFDSTASHNGLARLGLLLLTGAPGVLMAPLVAIEQSLLQARGRFYAAGLTSTLFTGTTLLFTFIAAWQESVFWCTAGLLLGAGLELACLRWLNKVFDEELTLGAVVCQADRAPSAFPWKAFLVFTVASIGVFFGGIYDQALLARLGVGSQALWGLAGRGPSFITSSLFAVAGVLSTMMFVRVHSGGPAALVREAQRLAAGILLASMATMGVLALIAHPFTALLYERGAFGAEDTTRVADVLRFAVLAYAFYPATAVLLRAASAQGLNRALLQSAGAFLAVKLVLGWWAHSRYGIPGIAVATSLSMVAQAGVLWLALRASTGTRPS